MTTSARNRSNTATSDNNNPNPQSEATTALATATATAAAAAAAAVAAATLHSSLSPNSTTNRVMQADEDFNIRFVNLVRTHKCLYDKKVPEYRNRDNQEKAWVLISKETCESVIHCKERWRNLRACLSRYIKQQSGSEPQHKPYYLTEHMAFLLPFLKSTRNSLEANSSLATLYHLSQQQHHQQQQQQQQQHFYNNNNHIMDEKLELKHSLSENDDEETIDAFDPIVAASLGLQRVGVAAPPAAISPALSDTASANTLQNFIPDVQLAESAQDLIYNTAAQGTPPHHHAGDHHHLHHHHYEPSGAKRIKTECEATTTTTTSNGNGGGGGGGFYGGLSGTEHTDMEFFRSILPDIAALTPQQRRKFKIGILELIDDVVERYPVQEQRYNGDGVVNGSGGSSAASGGGGSCRRRSSGRDWRK